MLSPTAFVVVLLLALAAGAAAQTGRCEVWAGAPELCRPYISLHAPMANNTFYIFVPDALVSQKNMANLIENSLDIALRAAPGPCRKSVTQLICLSVLLTCADERLQLGNTTLELPRFVCNAVCQGVNYECDALQGFEAQDCDQIEPNSGFPLYPPHATVIPLGNTSLEIPCFGDASFPPHAPPLDCPANFGYSREEDTCLPLCPDSMGTYSHQQRTIIHVFKHVFTDPAIPLHIYAVLPWLVVKDKRKYPTYVVTMFGLCAFAIIIGIFLTSLTAHPDDFICEDDFNMISHDVAICRAAAWLLMGGSTGALSWLSMLTVNCFVPLVKPDFKWPMWYELSQHFLTWSAVVTVILVAEVRGGMGQISPDHTVCGIGSEDDGKRSLLLPKFIIDTVFLVLALVMMITTTVLLFVHKARVHAASGLGGILRRMWKETSRNLIFVFLYCPVAVYGIFFEWYQFGLYDDIVDELTEFGKCNVRGGTNCEATDIPHLADTLLFFPAFGLYTALAYFLVFSLRSWVFKFYGNVARGEFTSISVANSESQIPNRNLRESA
eukprot:CAMPEP_0177648406 /NCGR_PEP_ID=MMETSP0447-20121125/10809_1 /TAXON_ID=0 /ORGANISM="Stygamoeba regulata, Strain BSH-02190019" /LENGTH=551 /DNA_ID=CAMNT_0019151041 /DNA_START=165 /DNA_END=1820 /DNA_ORIENTATION=-